MYMHIGTPLLRWLKARGGFLRGIRVEDAGPAGRRVVADRDLPAGLFHVFSNCLPN